MSSASIEDLQARLHAFARQRDRDQHHDRKNLAIALAAEVRGRADHVRGNRSREQ